MPFLSPTPLATVIRGLRAIFWGGLLVILDFKISESVNGSGFQLDLLNDTLGWILVLSGVLKLRPAGTGDLYRRRMTFVTWIAVLNLVDSLRSFTVGVRWPEALELASTVLGLCTLIAVVRFCSAMVSLSAEAGLLRSEAQLENVPHALRDPLFAASGSPGPCRPDRPAYR